METQEIKQKIKDYFVEIKEDKFTKVKTVKCKHNIIWKGKELENKFMLTKNAYSNELKMGIDYRHKDEVDSVFFTFIYANSDDGYPGMTNIKMYLILDDDKNIELSEGSGFDHTSQSSKVGDNYINVYLETAQLAVGMADFIAIANAKKIEYSIRFGQGSLENIFNEDNLNLFKGFYNAAFDDEFEFTFLNNLNIIKSYVESKERIENSKDNNKDIEVFINLIFEKHKNSLVSSKKVGFIFETKSGLISIGRTAIMIIENKKGFFSIQSKIGPSISWEKIQFIYNKNDSYFSKKNFQFEGDDSIIMKELIEFSHKKYNNK